jgi:hypothetical protein
MNMYNPFAPNPYIQQGQQQDIGGLNPVFQNMSAQQASQNAALAQQNQLMNQATQLGQQSGSALNPMAMAIALRKKDPKDPTKPAPVTDYSQPMPNYTDPAYMDAGY